MLLNARKIKGHVRYNKTRISLCTNLYSKNAEKNKKKSQFARALKGRKCIPYHRKGRSYAQGVYAQSDQQDQNNTHIVHIGK